MSVPLNAEIISEALEALRRHLKAVGVVGFTILVWDHVITFADEVHLCYFTGPLANPPQVEIIWGRPKNLLTFLFLLNRYLTPIGFIVNLVAYSLPSWLFIVHRCEHFVRYEGAMTAVAIQVVGLMMFLRVRAMYRDNRYVVIFVATLLFVWVAVSAWLLSHGVACRMEFSDCVEWNAESKLRGGLAAAWAWVPLCYDTVVFALTLNRTLPSMHNKEAGHIIHTLFINGVLFYSVMCAINLIFTIMVVRAPQGLKNITGQLELILTVAMMSRITLSLKKEGTRGSVPLDTHLGSKFPLCFDCQRRVQDIIKPQPPASSSQTPPIRTELVETQGHSGAIDGNVSSQRQRDSEVRTCFTCHSVTVAFDPADDERSRYREAVV
ncbi:uncharacterized protein BJ212DRAFT_1296654 [Suillus subaureus]|uniref:DUF6533 domain-containing protein n=1 Tax=Suillus subaureus TaxID=48587 RepID=A0A9P7JH02_9AGAM|nr:uncharacterized protein BJ212DRAFT_1296654 [Suillus subaureus]KAG1822655.1 hypothetical protein BJ212DRAFT_1296654 [Suillus subaureus]